MAVAYMRSVGGRRTPLTPRPPRAPRYSGARTLSDRLPPFSRPLAKPRKITASGPDQWTRHVDRQARWSRSTFLDRGMGWVICQTSQADFERLVMCKFLLRPP